MTIMGSSSESANKLKISLLYDPAIPVLGIWYLQSWFWKHIDRITNKKMWYIDIHTNCYSAVEE